MKALQCFGFLAVAFVGLMAHGPMAAAQPVTYEGYGSVTTGGAGGDVYHVTSLADSGPGTLRDGVTNRPGPRMIVFDVAGTIVLRSDLVVNRPYLTIDGANAPPPGITIQQNTIFDEFIIAGTHDIIINHLRFWGLYVEGGPESNNAATIAIDGDSGPDNVAQRIILDHITARGATDGGPDIWGEVRDLTISWSFIFYNRHPTTISHYPDPYQIRQRISMHHNVYAKNAERNPQIRADVRSFDYVNNIVYDWGFFGGWGYGIRIRNEAGEPKVNGNFVNNALIPRGMMPEWALVYGTDPGPDSTDGGPSDSPPQGTVITTSKMGSLWVSGNILPSGNRDQYSTVAAPLPVPSSAQVTTWPAAELGARVLPTVGMKYRTTEEEAILDEIGAALPPPPAVLSVAPLSLNFGDVTVGSTKDLTFTVQNTGGGTLTGTAASSSSPPFSIFGDNSFSLTAGATKSLTVRFGPQNPGVVAANVTFNSNAASPPLEGLSGNGVAAPAGSITVTSPAAGVQWANNSTHDITWTSSGVATGNVNIQLSRDGGSTWTTIVGNTPNDGSQSGKVKRPSTSTARIRVCTVNVPSVCGTSSNFTIQ
jgi:pectate lyase